MFKGGGRRKVENNDDEVVEEEEEAPPTFEPGDHRRTGNANSSDGCQTYLTSCCAQPAQKATPPSWRWAGTGRCDGPDGPRRTGSLFRTFDDNKCLRTKAGLSRIHGVRIEPSAFTHRTISKAKHSNSIR